MLTRAKRMLDRVLETGGALSVGDWNELFSLREDMDRLVIPAEAPKMPPNIGPKGS